MGATDLGSILPDDAGVVALSGLADTLIMVYPNAGLPNDLGAYDEEPDTTASVIREWVDTGLINVIGGCCGTTPGPSERWARSRGVQHKTLVDGARQMLLQIARWMPHRRIVAVADSSFSVIDLLDAVRARVRMVTRLRLDARLFAPAPPRLPRAVGRPPRTGGRLPTLAQLLVNPATCWQQHLVTDWYGAGERRIELATGCAVWSHPGRSIVPLRWLIVRDPAGRFRPEAFLATDTDADPADMLAWFIRRWTIEVTFAEVRRHLAVETQRQ